MSKIQASSGGFAGDSKLLDALQRIAHLEAEITDCLKVCQNYVTDFQALQMENERLREAVKNALKTPWVEPMSVIARQLLADALKKEGGKASE